MSELQGKNIIQQGLVLHLDSGNPQSFDGNSTIWRDLSGNGNNGTLVNGVGYSNNNRGVMTFDGTNDYCYIPYSQSLAPTSQISAFCWCYSTNYQTSSSVRLFSKTEAGGYQLSINETSSNFGALIHVNGAYYRVNINKSLVSNGWHYIGFIFDGRYFILYIDNIEKARTDIGSVLPITYTWQNNLVIGAESGNGSSNSIAGDYFPGQIPIVQVYNRALSQEEITQNFESTRNRFGI